MSNAIERLKNELAIQEDTDSQFDQDILWLINEVEDLYAEVEDLYADVDNLTRLVDMLESDIDILDSMVEDNEE